MNGRLLTEGEWAALSPGLACALRAAGSSPRISRRTHPAAHVAGLWRGEPPIMARGDVIFWPAAPGDLSAPGLEASMALLQHELQHVLDYRIGRLTALGYLARPRNWSYRVRLQDARAWDELGAEQRATIAERLWLVEHGLAPQQELGALIRLIPWRSG